MRMILRKTLLKVYCNLKIPEIYLLVLFGVLSLFLASWPLLSTTIIFLFDAFFLFALVSFSTLLMLVRVVKAEQLFCRLINVELTVFLVLLLIVRRYKFISLIAPICRLLKLLCVNQRSSQWLCPTPRFQHHGSTKCLLSAFTEGRG